MYVDFHIKHFIAIVKLWLQELIQDESANIDTKNLGKSVDGTQAIEAQASPTDDDNFTGN